MQSSAPIAKSAKADRPRPISPKFAGEMLNVVSDIMSVGHLDAVLERIASTVAELFSMRALVIAVLDPAEQLFRVRVTYGYDKERGKKIRKFTYTHERLRLDLEEKYRIADDVYLVRPEPGQIIKGEEPFYIRLDRISIPRTDPSVWHELDYIRFVVRSRDGEPIGFLEVNESENDRIPDAETIEAMRVFSGLAAVAIENATMFQRQVEIAQRLRFLSDIISHDINNCNQAVTSYVQMALGSKGLSSKVGTYLERASSSAWGISEIIQRANKLMKIEEEGAKNLGPIELGEILRESIAEVQRNNADASVKFDLKLGDRRYFVLGNELADEIFTNILENAVDYDPHDDVSVEISVGVFTVEPRRYWCVSIADNGIGIPDSKKNIVFGRFQETTDRPPGSGLGLSIVRAIVDAYHGIVWVEDRVPGDPSKGSIFRVALPMVSGK
ncbi:MAG: HAMP domain-containing histidine kinase [Candidatus Thermoplasmatota archaeon]|nr:HAMP domain-containing histidine kinase [Candidatus Thermoplasmatota archaeon]